MFARILIALRMFSFLFYFPRKNSFLLVELNPCHGELLPSWVRFLREKNIHPVLFVNKEIYRELQPLPKEWDDLAVFPFYYRFYKLFLNSFIFQRYRKIIFNSEYIYPAGENIGGVLRNYPKQRHKIIIVAHDMRKNGSYPADRIGLWEYDVKNFTPVYFQYYGNAEIQAFSDGMKRLLVVGGANPECRNMELLYPVLYALPEELRKKIRITVIGFKIPKVPEDLKMLFELKGRCSYPVLYDEVRRSHAVLMLLSPENPNHLRYKAGIVSGNVNLSFGFCCPMVIEEQFAHFYGVSCENSFIYQGDGQLVRAVEECLMMPREKYCRMKACLAAAAQRKYAESVVNLQRLLQDGVKNE